MDRRSRREAWGTVACVPTDDEVSRILVITAHPDDVDFGAAGSVAVWTGEGREVAYCVVTDGDAGGFDPAVPRSEIPGIRRAEQTAAAKEVGVTDLTFLGYPDGRLEVSVGLRRDLSRVIRRFRPHRVLCPSPERMWDRIFASHPDHLAAGEAAICAVYPDARNPFAHPELAAEGWEAWTVPEVWIMAHGNANRWVDITETIDRKVAALRSHVSQMTDPDGVEERVRTWGQATATAGGLPDGRMAEAFMAVATG
jgi:LmbE family N-acetylglucosaminyl deacetylase